jgi:hypothetical protein
MIDCLQSFNINIRQNATFGATQTITWSDFGNRYFDTKTVNNDSYFDIQGFKNVDLYGISLSGYVTNNKDAASGAVTVLDWMFELSVTGIQPAISGIVNTTVSNDWALNFNNSNALKFYLGKYNRDIKFSSPISSVTAINFLSLNASGLNAQTSDTASLSYFLGFTFYYKYEGE